MNYFNMYEDDLDFFEASIVIERTINQSNISIDLEYYTEASIAKGFKKTIDTIIKAIKSLIQKCIDALTSAGDKISEDVSKMSTKHKLNTVLDDFDKKIASAQKSGMKSFEFVDIVAIKKCLTDEIDDYQKILNTFAKSYLKSANPKDAEKMLKQFKETSEDYNKKIEKILSTKKKYPLTKARMIEFQIKNDQKHKDDGFHNIFDKYRAVCKNIEDVVVNTMKSLDEYSKDTGYVQNAKLLQDIIYNSCIRIKTHASQCASKVLQYGIPLVCAIDSAANTKLKKKTIKVGDLNVDAVIPTDTSSRSHQIIRDGVSLASSAAGYAIDKKDKEKNADARHDDLIKLQKKPVKNKINGDNALKFK